VVARDQPVLRSSRREAIVSLVVWFVALVYSVGVCWRFGYHRPVETIGYVMGFPDWVFWGLIVPWLVATAITIVFAYFGMTTEPLEDDR
jgi:hypothetical protein